jgi:flagellar motor switch protein FliN/FliY
MVEDFKIEDFGLSSKNTESVEGGSEEETNEASKDVDLSRIKMIMDVPLKITVELGRTKLMIHELLQLGQGSIIELDKMAGEAMEIYVNEKLIAMGEVVVVNEKFGVRLTDVMSGVQVDNVKLQDTV